MCEICWHLVIWCGRLSTPGATTCVTEKQNRNEAEIPPHKNEKSHIFRRSSPLSALFLSLSLMSSNQGLDALAALAAAATPTGGANSAASVVPSSHGDGANANGSASSDAAALAASLVAPPPMAGITSQQWQQAVATAAASINALTGSQSHLSHLAPLTGPSNSSSLLAMQQQIAMQQQMNYYQLLASSQRSFSGSQSLPANLVPPSSAGSMDAATSQALSLALSGGQSSHAAVNGMSSSLLCFRFVVVIPSSSW